MVFTSTTVTLGKIDEFVIDPHARAVVAVTLKKTDEGNTLRWLDITAFGADANTLVGADRLTAAPPELARLPSKDHQILGSRVLATTG